MPPVGMPIRLLTAAFPLSNTVRFLLPVLMPRAQGVFLMKHQHYNHYHDYVNDLLEKHGYLSKRSKQCSSVYIINSDVAEDVARFVVQHRTRKDGVILEANPGPGVLTRHLLKLQVPRLVGAEARQEFLPYLDEIAREVGEERYQYFHWDPFSLYRRNLSLQSGGAMFLDKEQEVTSVLPVASWTDDPPVSCVGALMYTKENRFLNYLVYHFTQPEGLFGVGRIEWFLFMSAKVYKGILACLNENKSMLYYNKLYISLHLFFDIQLVQKFPGDCFYPRIPVKRKKKGSVEKEEVDEQHLYLVKLVPHRNLAELLPREEVPSFVDFLRQLLPRRSQRIIPKMEQLVPGCGIHMIRDGFSMVQLIGQTSPQELLSLYKSMVQWREFQESGLRHFMLGRSGGRHDDADHDTPGLSQETASDTKLQQT